MEKFQLRSALLSAAFSFGIGIAAMAIVGGLSEHDGKAVVVGIVCAAAFIWGATRYSAKIVQDANDEEDRTGN